MKRPLAWICIACMALLVLARTVWGTSESPPDLAAQQLEESGMDGAYASVRGIVSACSTVAEGFRYTIRQISIVQPNNSELSFSSDLTVSVTILSTEQEQNMHTLLPGDAVELYGKLQTFDGATNPGQFDLRKWYHAQRTIASVRDAQLISVVPGSWSPSRALQQLRNALRQSYQNILEEREARTIAAITLGERSLLESEWKEEYQEGGISHMFSISGLHVTLIGMALYHLLRRRGLPFSVCAAVSALTAVLYIQMTGQGVSSCRAGIMFALWLGAQVCGRKYDTVTGTALAALLLTATDASGLQQASFALSFGGVISIGVLYPAAMERLSGGIGQYQENRKKRRRKRILDTWIGDVLQDVGSSMLACLMVWLGTLPLSLWFYYQTEPWSILVNLIILPLMPSLMGLGLLASAVGLVSAPAGIFLAGPVGYLIRWINRLCLLERCLPLAVWVTGRPQLWQILCYYAVLGAVLYLPGSIRRRNGRTKKPDRRWISAGRLLVCVALMAGAVAGLTWKFPSDLTVTMLDVGQGDSCLVQLPGGSACLMDGGSSSRSSLWDQVVSQAVKYYGIRRLDYIFLSHDDQDHTSAVTEFLETYEPNLAGENVHGISVGALVLPVCNDSGDFASLILRAQECGIPVLRMDQGDVIGPENRENDWQLVCLSPSEDTLTGEKNQDSMVLKLCCGSFRMLFTGDLEKAAEQRLVQSGADLQADVLKVGHHGSAGASSEAFLEQVNAAVGLISCGLNNRYGHPAQAALERLEDAGCKLLRTDLSGAITIREDGQKITVYTNKTFVLK